MVPLVGTVLQNKPLVMRGFTHHFLALSDLVGSAGPLPGVAMLLQSFQWVTSILEPPAAPILSEAV